MSVSSSTRQGASIGIFAKAPIPGQTKTRLARHIGHEAAASLHAAFLRDTVERLSALAPCVLFTAGAHPLFAELSERHEVPCVAQEGSDLGERMENAITRLVATHAQAILVGSDSPTLPTRIVKRAFESGLAFGPSVDGGFYLVSAAARPNFAGIEWSQPSTLADTLEKNPGATVLEPWFDVDHIEDLALLRTHLAMNPSAAPATAAFLSARASSLV